MKSSTLFAFGSAAGLAAASPFLSRPYNGTHPQPHNGTFSNSTCTSLNQRKAW